MRSTFVPHYYIIYGVPNFIYIYIYDVPTYYVLVATEQIISILSTPCLCRNKYDLL